MRYLVVFFTLLLFFTSIPQPAAAFDAVTGKRMIVRAGPGGLYPLIGELGANTPVTVHGCLETWKWCDVSTTGFRGWVSGANLVTPYRSNPVTVLDFGTRLGVPIVTFTERDYWGNYYSDRAFYRARYGFWERGNNGWGWQREDGKWVDDGFDKEDQPWSGRDNE